MPGTVGSVLAEKAQEIGDKPMIEFEGTRYSYSDSHFAANRIANCLSDLGVKKGSNTAVMLPNSPEFLFSWFGAATIGSPVVPVNTALKGEGLTHILNHSESEALIVHADYWPNVEAIKDSLPALKRVISMGRAVDGQDGSVEDFLKSGSTDDPGVDVSPADLMMVMYSSGTTGLPKGVVMPQGQVMGGSLLLNFGGVRPDDVLYTCLPLFHANAAIISVWGAIGYGTRLVLGRRFSASRFWDEIRQSGATEFNALGAMIPILWKQEPKPDDADNPVRIVLSAACPKDIWRTFEERFGVQIIEFYGTVEGGLTMAGPDAPVGSIGKPLPINEMKVVDDDDNELGPGEVGELIAKPMGAGSLVNYYKDEKATEEKTRGGWLRTGDYAYKDEDGFLWFVDRKKDVIRRRGENISSYEVEQIVNEHPSVLESAAYAIKSDVGEDDVAVAVVLQPGADFDPEGIIRHCIANMAYFQVPRYLRAVPEIDKTGTHRVRKQALRADGVTEDTWDIEESDIEVPRP
ncbi:MAG: ATP-dependent acyl-CoA ligase [Acidobacteria bacterium]|nr:MAG: ATP-dependent acyl-CoA ligase [Acidobacteriota bacterium]